MAKWPQTIEGHDVSNSASRLRWGGAVIGPVDRAAYGSDMKQSPEEKKLRFKEVARRKLAGVVDSTGSAERLSAPAGGYIRWMREGLGQTRETVAGKMGIAAQSFAGYEDAEAEGTIRLATLRRAALALNCTFVYALVPDDMFKPHETIHDIGAMLDEMAELTARAQMRTESLRRLHPAVSSDSDHMRTAATELKDEEDSPSTSA